jgi:hypothetical protein
MNNYFVIFSLVAYVTIYCWFSIRVKSWVNVLTLHFALSIATLFLAEIGYLSITNDTRTSLGYFVVYFTYVASLFAFVVGYLHVRVPKTFYQYDFRITENYNVALFFMVAAVAVYWPIMREFSDDLLNPRRIYVATRTGYGVSYFISMMLCYIFLILALFNQKISTLTKAFSFVIAVIFGYLHGSKGQVISAIFIWVTYFYVARARRVGFFGFFLFGMIIAVAGVGIFYISLNSVELSDLLSMIAGYADYSRNAAMLIDNEATTFFGRLTFEDNFFSRVPRVLFPDKPKDFGSFLLAQKYFPDAFERDEGVPSFGIGAFYADFSVLSILVLMIANFFGGILTKVFAIRVQKFRSPVDFSVLVFMCGITLLPIGGGYLLPEHLLIACVIFFAHRLPSMMRIRRM